MVELESVHVPRPHALARAVVNVPLRRIFPRRAHILRIDARRVLWYSGVNKGRALRRHVLDVMCRVGGFAGIVVLRVLRALSLLLIERIGLNGVCPIRYSLHRHEVVADLLFKDQHRAISCVRLIRNIHAIRICQNFRDRCNVLAGHYALPTRLLNQRVSVVLDDMAHIVTWKDRVVALDVHTRFLHYHLRCARRDLSEIGAVHIGLIRKRTPNKIYGILECRYDLVFLSARKVFLFVLGEGSEAVFI